MQKSDSGLSYVVGFTLLLMIVAMIIGTWALVGVPEQIKDAESYHAVTVTNAFLDYKIAVDDLRLKNQTGVNVSMLIPAACSYSAGTVSLADEVGTMTISNDNTLWQGTMTRLSATFGTRSTIIGYEGGGVYRADYGYAAWVTPPMFELDNVSNDLYVTIVFPELVGSFAVASTEGIPVDTGLDPSFVWSMYSTNQTVTISYTADPGPATNPTLSGWILKGVAVLNAPYYFHNSYSWLMGESTTSAGMFAYDATATQQTQMKNGGWEASWNMEPYTAAAVSRLIMQVGDGEKLFRLSYVKADGVYLFNSTGAYTRISDIASGVVQLSEMSYDPADGGVLTVTVGGVVVATQARADAYSSVDNPGVAFGNGTVAVGSAFINSMDFTVSDVPEPTTMSLIGLAGLAFLRRKRK